MQLTLRPYVTAGVALVGASVIVASTVQPPLPDIRVSAEAVQLSAASVPPPADVYPFIFNKTVGNAGALVNTASADPASAALGPILALGRILESQPGSLQDILDGLGISAEQLFTTVPAQLLGAAGSFEAGRINSTVNILQSVPLAVLNPILAKNPALAAVLLGLAGPAISSVGATVDALQLIIDASNAGDPQETLNAVLDGPAVIADGVFNGGYGPDLAAHPNTDPTVLAGGILSEGTVRDDGSVVLPGPIATLLPPGQQTLQIKQADSQEKAPALGTWKQRVSKPVIESLGVLTGGKKVSLGANSSNTNRPVRAAVNGLRDQVKTSIKTVVNNVRDATGLGSKTEDDDAK